MEAAAPIVCVTDDLSLIVDSSRRREYPARVWRNQIVEILQFAIAVNEGMLLCVAIAEQHIRSANHHPRRVDRSSDAGVEEDSKVGHLPAAREKRMHRAC